MIVVVLVLALIGFVIATYTYVTEQKVKNNPEYKPFCDISDQISCTKVMKSDYAHLFFISNSVAGMFFYVLTALLAYFDFIRLLMWLSLAGCAVSCLLAYILYFKIRSLCLLCTATYVINFLLAVYSVMLVVS